VAPAFVVGVFLEVLLEHGDQLVERGHGVFAFLGRKQFQAVAAPGLVFEGDLSPAPKSRTMNRVRSERP
jgi:hypothetical protein